MQEKKLFTAQLVINWITRILFFICLASLLPTLPTYLNDIGGNNSQIGIVMSAFAMGVLIFRPLVGKQVDAIGRKAVLIIGIIIFIISPILYIYIQSISILLPVRIFHGLGLAAFGTASITLITDAAPKDKRTEAISYTGMINTIAFALGPLTGSYIGDKMGYNFLFTFVSGLAIVCLIFALFLKETRTKSDDEQENINYLKVIKHRRILISASLVLLIGIVHGGIMFYIPLFLKDNVDINVGLFFTIYGTAAFLIRMAISPISKTLGRGLVLVLSLCSLIISILFLSISSVIIFMIFSSILYGIGFGSTQPTLTTLVADNSSEETRGKIFSFYYGGFDLGISLSGLILGAIAELYGIRNMFFVCAVLIGCALLIFTTLMETSVSKSAKCALFVPKPGRAKCYVDEPEKEPSIAG